MKKQIIDMTGNTIYAGSEEMCSRAKFLALGEPSDVTEEDEVIYGDFLKDAEFLKPLFIIENWKGSDYDIDIECESVSCVIASIMHLIREKMDEDITIIFSMGSYFIETGVPFIRTGEKQMWLGKPENFTLKTIIKWYGK